MTNKNNNNYDNKDFWAHLENSMCLHYCIEKTNSSKTYKMFLIAVINKINEITN